MLAMLCLMCPDASMFEGASSVSQTVSKLPFGGRLVALAGQSSFEEAVDLGT